MSQKQPETTPGHVDQTVNFGRYRLIERIGAGGMAEIYRAVAVGAQGFARTVAIKRIREEVAGVADIGRLFADEARLSALLDHPNIVQVYDFGSVEGDHYIAMEHLKGRNLDEVTYVLRRMNERLEPALALFIAREVARGLAYAHALTDERGRPLHIVHRDVSPANIMLVHAGAVKLLDFGIARVQSELRQAVTQGRALRGKCPYLAPEQITGGRVDARSDIFALGVVLWEMLTGQRLFRGDSDVDTIEAVLSKDIPRPTSMAPDLPPALDHIVMAALARDPERRYRSADQLAADLDEVMRAMPSRHGDITALLVRLFGSITGDVPVPASESPGVPVRFALELAGISQTPHDLPPIDRQAVTRRLETVAPPPAAPAHREPVWAPVPSVATTSAPPPSPARSSIDCQSSRVPSLRSGPAGRWSLLLVLAVLVGTELVSAALVRGFGPPPERPVAGAVAPPAPAPVAALPCQAPAPAPAAAATAAAAPPARKAGPRKSSRRRRAEARARALRHAHQAAMLPGRPAPNRALARGGR